MARTVLEMTGINKSFDSVQVLYDVSFDLYEGEVKGLIGENGAGKSTLMKILSGEYQKNTGEIRLFGEKVEMTSPAKAISMGISMVYQELDNAPDMSIAENMFMGREVNKWGILNKKKMCELTRDYLRELDLDFDPSTKMRDLSVSEMQMVEIAKAVSYQSKIIVMDEPTSSITRTETEKLFRTIRLLKEKNISIIYISHKLEELFEITDRISVMRDGRMVKTDRSDSLTKEELVRLMVGRTIDDIFPEKVSASGPVMLKAEGLSKKGQFKDISFEVREGEIVGFAGLVGSGRTETMMTLFGDRKADKGRVWIRGNPVRLKNTRKSVAAHMALVPEDRKLYGLNLSGTIEANTTMVVLSRDSRAGIVDRKKSVQKTNDMVKALSIKCNSIRQLTSSLSGGNQQKVVLAKWLLSNPDIIIFDEPTRGIDVGAKMEIYKIINSLAREKKAVVVVSSEMNEIIGLCNKVVVLYEGRVTGVLEGSDVVQEKIMAYACNQGGEKS